jgi:hypothetical protein
LNQSYSSNAYQSSQPMMFGFNTPAPSALGSGLFANAPMFNQPTKPGEIIPSFMQGQKHDMYQQPNPQAAVSLFMQRSPQKG